MSGGTAISSRMESTVSPFLPSNANSLRASLRGVAVLCSQRSSVLPYLLIAPVCCRPPEDSSLGFSPR
jgi:hypothetical protein